MPNSLFGRFSENIESRGRRGILNLFDTFLFENNKFNPVEKKELILKPLNQLFGVDYIFRFKIDEEFAYFAHEPLPAFKALQTKPIVRNLSILLKAFYEPLLPKISEEELKLQSLKEIYTVKTAINVLRATIVSKDDLLVEEE